MNILVNNTIQHIYIYIYDIYKNFKILLCIKCVFVYEQSNTINQYGYFKLCYSYADANLVNSVLEIR